MKYSTIKEAYENLPNRLVAQYPELPFENHCYLRIALDWLCKAKWDTKINRPAYKHLTEKQKLQLQLLLKGYLTHRKQLLAHHKASLTYRKSWKKQLTLPL